MRTSTMVAVAVGHWLRNEAIGMRTALGSLMVLGSVAAIITTRAKTGR